MRTVLGNACQQEQVTAFALAHRHTMRLSLAKSTSEDPEGTWSAPKALQLAPAR